MIKKSRILKGCGNDEKKNFLKYVCAIMYSRQLACSEKEVEKAQVENDVKVEAEKYDDDSEPNGTVYVLNIDKVHQKKDFCFVFDIKNNDITAKNCVFEKNTISME